MALSFRIFISLCILLDSTHAHFIDCTNEQCQNKFINCLPYEDCFISCGNTASCKESVINCPMNGDCIIECHGIQSCAHTIIDATLQNGNLNIECSETHNQKQLTSDHCNGMQVFGSTLSENTGNFNLKCDGHLRACFATDILCPFNSDCAIFCDGNTSCTQSKIIGPRTGDLNINCNGIQSCFNGQFDGVNSDKLRIKGCTERESCLDLSLHCPTRTNHEKNCFVKGNDNFGQYNGIKVLGNDKIGVLNAYIVQNNNSIHNGLVIYAINGWRDIDIEYGGTFGDTHAGMMFCGENFDVSCEISPNKWSCLDENSMCNGVGMVHAMDIVMANTNSSDEYERQGMNVMDVEMDIGQTKKKETFLDRKYIVLGVFGVITVLCLALIGWVVSKNYYQDHVEGDTGHILSTINEQEFELI